MKKAILFLAVVALCVSCAGGRAGRPSTSVVSTNYQALIIKDFSLEGARIQDNADIRVFSKELPAKFSSMVKDYAEEMRVVPKVVLEANAASVDKSADFLILEGSFTVISAGSAAARIIVGFGAGSSDVGARWRLKDGKTNNVIASYEKDAHTVSGYTGMMAVESDARALAKIVAQLMKKAL